MTNSILKAIANRSSLKEAGLLDKLKPSNWGKSDAEIDDAKDQAKHEKELAAQKAADEAELNKSKREEEKDQQSVQSLKNSVDTLYAKFKHDAWNIAGSKDPLQCIQDQLSDDSTDVVRLALRLPRDWFESTGYVKVAGDLASNAALQPISGNLAHSFFDYFTKTGDNRHLYLFSVKRQLFNAYTACTPEERVMYTAALIHHRNLVLVVNKGFGKVAKDQNATEISKEWTATVVPVISYHPIPGVLSQAKAQAEKIVGPDAEAGKLKKDAERRTEVATAEKSARDAESQLADSGRKHDRIINAIFAILSADTFSKDTAQDTLALLVAGGIKPDDIKAVVQTLPKTSKRETLLDILS